MSQPITINPLVSTADTLAPASSGNVVFPNFRYMQEADSSVALASRVAKTAAAIQTESDLLAWVQGPLRELIPCQSALLGYGHVRYGGLTVDRTVSVDLPESYAPSMKAASGEFASPVMESWFKTREPQAIDPAKYCRVRYEKWLLNLKKHGIKNGIVDGHVESQTGNVVFVKLFNFADDPYQYSHVMRNFCTDNVRDAWKRIEQFELAAREARKSAFTKAERDILEYIKLGKSNWEIGQILNKSEHTIKTQLAKLYEKTGTGNRTQLSLLDL